MLRKLARVVLIITLRRHHNAQMLGRVIIVIVKMTSAHIKRVDILASAVRDNESTIVKSHEKLVPIHPPTNTSAIKSTREGFTSQFLPLHKNCRAFSV